jgi:hypothetical protein
MVTRPYITFPAPPLKFRTAGFPQYGFKPDFGRHLRHRIRRRLISGQESGHPAPTSGPHRGQASPPDEVGLAGSPNAPVQRPLARQRVMLSRQVFAYYGLIRASGPHPPAYVLRPAGAARPRGSQLLSAYPSSRAIGPTPADRPLSLDGVGGAVVLAFAVIRPARHPQARASRFTPGSVTRLHRSLHATARELARLAPTQAFPLELSSQESPPWNVEDGYAGNHLIPAAGLTPAGQAALLAAPNERE